MPKLLGIKNEQGPLPVRSISAVGFSGFVAGGSVAGGSVAGGSVAGGLVAGGLVAGGSVAGGLVAGGSSEESERSAGVTGSSDWLF